MPDADVLILDWAPIVNMLKPGACQTFKDYVDNVFIKYLERQLHRVSRIDIVWDVYKPDSLKSTAHSRQGKGVRRRVESRTRVPSNWQSCLREDENKSELFEFLAEESVKLVSKKQIISTKGRSVICSQSRELDNLQPCKHEEADTRIFLHAQDAAKEGYRKMMVRTVDTDVVVLGISIMQQLDVTELWIAFGVGKSFRYLSVHSISEALGMDKSRSLSMFHAFTGCDQTSFFSGRGKKTSWNAWQVFDEVTEAFKRLMNVPSIDTLQDVMPVLERFVVLMYDRSSICMNVNDAHKELFAHRGRSIESIPPTADALFQHSKRSVYQSGYCWGQCLVCVPELPSPSDWGWQKGPDQTW